ncbi:MAG: class I SAM-dependent methyltransferase [Mizugakiibacter sp.]|uniref:class I SAM-dependent methyltransferase n=1 Tax=Mizugakiibacter sp. TaxID=1972610 RepID=UPI0031BFB68D|nr:class I SAM-dependent methyltransferase [Xanthomonadaceae bacterium]
MPPADLAIARIVRRLPSRGLRGYASGKLRIDPVYAEATRILAGSPLGLLDIGCGMGLLGAYLREHGWRGDYLGIDNDPRKIAAGRAAVAGVLPPLRLEAGDDRALPAFSGHVALLDVLHYLPAPRQRALLAAAAAHVAPDGLLLIRNVLRDRSWRYHATVFEEHLLRLSRWMRTGATYFPSLDEIRGPLQDAGLRVECRPLWGRTPFNSHIVTARRA